MNAMLPSLDEARASPGEPQSRIDSLGNMSLDLNTYRLTIDGEPVDLTYYELELLHLFFQNPGRVLPYQFWSNGVLGKTDHGALRHLAVLVHRLRTKISRSTPYAIETVRGRGYGLLVTRDRKQQHA